MTYPPTPGPDGSQPPPPDPPVQAYTPPQAYPLPQPYTPPEAYQPPQSSTPLEAYPPAQSYANPQAYQLPAPQDPYAPQVSYGQGAVDQYGYAAPQYDYAQPGSPYAYSPYPPGARPTEGMAIASLAISCVSVLGLCAWGVGGLLGILGAIFGHIARRRIRQSGAGGSGMALAGIIIGWIVTALMLAFAVLIVIAIATDDSSSSSTF
ncbi:DUF4190 domain-containing protein [Actinoplanes sp. NPDC051475]|uniref:DUF4190 domain-containing protein n=1 Tax=Actinoplanes sp. NPDC051475 TaxID=3157225 RepID=UPI00344B0914